MEIKKERYMEKYERCTVWVQNNQKHQKNISELHSEDPLQQSTDEDVSQGPPWKRRKRNSSQEEDLSELSETSHNRHKNLHISQDDNEVDTSVASEELSVMTAKKPLALKDEVLSLRCEWKDCKFFTTELEPFVNHVASHIPQLAVKCSEEDNEEVYACLWELCDFETPNADEVVRHVNFHSYHTKVKDIGALICKSWNLPKCNYGTVGVNLVPDLPKPFQCLWSDCTLTSNNPNIFYGHVAMHASEIPIFTHRKNVAYKCHWKACKSDLPNRKRMVEHLRTHTKERVAACPTCGILYSSRMRLVDHIKRQAPEECMTYQCTHCSRSYPSERILRDHMRHHVNHFKCQFCDMTCPTPHSLSHHIRQRHIDDRPFACGYCDYKTKTQYNLKRHMQTHSTTDSFFCEEENCNYTCRTLNMLNWHYRKKHECPPVYCCHMCDSRFARGAYLSQHLMRKHNFRWPSGHTRFRFYKNHEDGLFRLQTVRYESLEVVEDINRGVGEEASVLNRNSKFNILKASPTSGSFEANFIVREGENDVDDPDDPSQVDENQPPESQNTSSVGALSMPSLDIENALLNKKVLISIDEVDEDGNIISSKTVEAEELTDVAEIEDAQVVVDGNHILF